MDKPPLSAQREVYLADIHFPVAVKYRIFRPWLKQKPDIHNRSDNKCFSQQAEKSIELSENALSPKQHRGGRTEIITLYTDCDVRINALPSIFQTNFLYGDGE